jgi:fructose-specific phosphotransferase system IIC component
MKTFWNLPLLKLIPATSRRHALAFIIVAVWVTLMKLFLPSWGDLSFNDEDLGIDWSSNLATFFIQLLLLVFITTLAASFFEGVQQLKLSEKPPLKDTVADIVVTVIFSVLGFLIVEFLFMIL